VTEDETPHRRPTPRPSSGRGRPRVAGQRGRRQPDSAPVEDASQPKRAARQWRLRRTKTERTDRRRLIVAVAAVLTVGFAVVAGIFGTKLYDGRVRNSNRADVLRIVPQYASQVLSFDYRHLADNSAAAKPLLSGAYRTEYAQSMTKNSAQWKKYHYVVKSKVASAGVSQASGSRVVVVAFIDQTVSATSPSTAKKKGKSGSATEPIRLRLTVQREHGHWLLSKLDAL
jgi:Mce-associated membrane protein